MFTVTTGGDFVKRKLSPWCKEVKKTLIDRDMTVTDLCDQVFTFHDVSINTVLPIRLVLFRAILYIPRCFY